MVTGVGHEIDVTIADLVADARAATPSNAAEIVVPEKEVLVGELRSLERRLSQALESRVGALRLRLERMLRSLHGARRVITPVRQALRQWNERLRSVAYDAIRRRRKALLDAGARVSRHDPRTALRTDRRLLRASVVRLRDAGRLPIQRRREELVRLTAVLESRGRPLIREARATHAAALARLDALSPLRVLERGYAIVLREEAGRAVRHVDEVSDGDRLRVRVSDGSFRARVEGDE